MPMGLGSEMLLLGLMLADVQRKMAIVGGLFCATLYSLYSLYVVLEEC